MLLLTFLCFIKIFFAFFVFFAFCASCDSCATLYKFSFLYNPVGNMLQKTGLFIGPSLSCQKFVFSKDETLQTILQETLGKDFECLFLSSQKISLWVNGSAEAFGLEENNVATCVWNDEQCWLESRHLCENFFGNAIFLGDFDDFGTINGLSQFQFDFLASFL